MYLKKMVCKGFKSFEKTTTMEFIPGITAIIGPNGSGKSNVVDALVWVMGEQSALAMRSKNMHDVIFGGTQTKKALGRASVEITIDNSDAALPIDYLEVSISRTLYQNGSSVYTINQDEVRLQDVQDLLSDSNLGKAMHNVIGQGKLDSILNASPIERRILIEEASGILKYKTKKEKTLRKLNSEEINISRVEDIIFELKRQMVPLGRQAKQAKTAGEVRRDFIDAKKRLLADDLYIITQKKEEIEKKLNNLLNEIKIETSSLNDKHLSKKTIVEDISKNNPKLQKLVETIHRVEILRNKYISLGALANNKKSNLEDQDYSNLDKNYKKLIDEQTNINFEVASLKSKIDILKTTIDSRSNGLNLIEFLLKGEKQVQSDNEVKSILNVIKIEKEYEETLKNILDKIFIAKDDNVAKDFSKKNREVIVLSNSSKTIFSTLSTNEDFGLLDSKIESQYNDSKKEFENKFRQKQEIDKKVDDFQKKLNTSQKNKVKELDIHINKIHQTLQTLDTKIQNLKDAKIKLEESLVKNDKTLNKVNEEIEKIEANVSNKKDSLHSLELEKNSYEVNFENLERQSNEEFEMLAQDLIQNYGPKNEIEYIDENKNIVREKYNRELQIEKLKKSEKKLGTLGKINPLALEEYEAITQRYNHLSKELEDLKVSKKKLLEIISNMDDKVKNTFIDSFADTKKHFEEIFPRLFPGGFGTIELEDKQDILTTGILVLAQPQGKKLKSMNLLSGGERSLCSLALMISIFISRPSPFYILDEVEAALDEINLLRLLDVFKDLRDISQLLIITHQKQTMTIADAIYGVSMNKEGVSQVINKKLENNG